MTFYEKYCELCRQRGLKPHSKELAAQFGITNAAVTRWKNGGVPKTETLDRIAKYFGVSVDWLINGGEAANSDELINGDPELTEFLEMLATRDECRMLFHLSKDATKEDVELAVRIIEDLRNRDKR